MVHHLSTYAQYKHCRSYKIISARERGREGERERVREGEREREREEERERKRER